MTYLQLPHGQAPLPAFFPDGTYGVVRCLDSADLEECATPGLVMNGFHLLTKPGLNVIRALGGLHGFAGWPHPILTDSGGFQVFSMIRENEKYGSIRKNEILFRPDGGSAKVTLSPEKSIQSQFAFGSDIMMCLDYCTHVDDPPEITLQAVETTVAWAKRCREEYEKQLAMRKVPQGKRPLIFAIVQGGADRQLRSQCADALKAIGFDGYGFGGWPLDSAGKLDAETLRYTASVMPDDQVKYAMGVGRPEEIVACLDMGYTLFDCVIPTREARHGRLYAFRPDAPLDAQGGFYRFHYVMDEEHVKDPRPVDETCDCLACRRYSRAYLRHLYKAGDSAAYRLGTIHNVRFYARLMERLRQSG